MTTSELTTIMFAILYLLEVRTNFMLKKIIKELLEENKNEK